MWFYSLSRHKGVAALFVAKYLRIFALGGGQMATLLVSVADPYPSSCYSSVSFRERIQFLCANKNAKREPPKANINRMKSKLNAWPMRPSLCYRQTGFIQVASLLSHASPLLLLLRQCVLCVPTICGPPAAVPVRNLCAIRALICPARPFSE